MKRSDINRSKYVIKCSRCEGAGVVHLPPELERVVGALQVAMLAEELARGTKRSDVWLSREDFAQLLPTVTTTALLNRLDRLVKAGVLSKRHDPDRVYKNASQWRIRA